jgi:hypothetical protein
MPFHSLCPPLRSPRTASSGASAQAVLQAIAQGDTEFSLVGIPTEPATRQRGHEGGVYSIAFSSNGERVATVRESWFCHPLPRPPFFLSFTSYNALSVITSLSRVIYLFQIASKKQATHNIFLMCRWAATSTVACGTPSPAPPSRKCRAPPPPLPCSPSPSPRTTVIFSRRLP